MIDSFYKYLQETGQEASKGPVEALAAYYGRLVGPALQAPGNAIQSAISPGQNKQVFEDALDTGGRLGSMLGGGPNMFPAFSGGALGASWADSLFGTHMSQGLKDFASQAPHGDAGAFVSNLQGTAALDPLTYIGSGALPKAFGPAEHMLQGGINKAFLAPALAPKWLANAPIPGIGNVLKRTSIDPITDAVQQIPAKSVGDYLWGGPGRRANLAGYSDDIKNITDHLMQAGRDLDFDIGDLQNARNGDLFTQFDPRNPTGALQSFRDSITQTYRQIAGQSADHGREARDIINQYGEEMRNSPPATPEDLHNMAGSLAESLRHVASQVGTTAATDLSGIYRRRMASLKYLTQGQSGILADLPEDLQRRAEIAFGAMSKHGEQLQGDRAALEAGIKEYWDLENGRRGGALGKYNPIAGAGSAQDLTTQINARLQTLGLPVINPTEKDPLTAQLISRLQGLIDPKAHNAMSKVAETWGTAGDPLTDNAYKLVMDKTVRDKAIELGLDPSKAGLFSGLDKFTSFWKTVNLMSPKYLLGNIGSGLVMSQMAGVDAGQISKNFAGNLWNMLRGNQLNLPELAQQNRMLGLPEHHVPAGVSDSAGLLQDSSTLRDMAGKGQDILSKVGALPMAAGGALLGGYGGYQRAQETPEDDTLRQTLLGMGVGAATGGTMPALSRKFYTPLAQGTEHVLRSQAFVEGRSRFLSQQVPALVDTIENAMGSRLPQAFVDRLQNSKGLVSEQNLDKILTHFRVDPSIRTEAIQSWRNVLHDSSQAGTDLSNHINFDYKNLNNFEEFARQVFPFSTWGTKAMPFFAQHIAEHPVIGSTIARYEDETAQRNKRAGLSPSFAGSSEIPATSDIWATLTGRPGSHAFFNPLKDLFPAADAQRSLGFEPGDHTTAYQHTQRLLDVLGLSIHPVAALAARLANQDPGSPSEGIGIRQAAPIQAVTGIDLAALPRQAERVARQAMGQEEPADGRAQAALRRMDELALSRTGQPITSKDPAVQAQLAPFIRGKYDRSGPLWDEALASTDRERGARSAVGFVAPFVTPSATLSAEGARISGARGMVQLSPTTTRVITQNAREMPTASGNPQVVQELRAAAQSVREAASPGSNGQLPPDVENLLNVPTWENLGHLQSMIYDAQSKIAPESRGYSGSGSPEKQRLQQAISAYMDTKATIANRPEFKNLSPADRDQLVSFMDYYDKAPPEIRRGMVPGGNSPYGIPMLSAAQKAITEERARMTQETPMLGRYLEYRKANPQGSVEDFLDNVYPHLRGS